MNKNRTELLEISIKPPFINASGQMFSMQTQYLFNKKPDLKDRANIFRIIYSNLLRIISTYEYNHCLQIAFSHLSNPLKYWHRLISLPFPKQNHQSDFHLLLLPELDVL